MPDRDGAATEHVFTIGHLFSGIGGGALGTAAAVARFGGHAARFHTLPGIDLDELACRDFEYLVDAPAHVRDVHDLSPSSLRDLWGPRRPDAVLMSPPCKGFSGLLAAKRAAEPQYQRMNSLLLRGLFLLTETWDEPPPILFVENVPRITARGIDMLRQVRALLVARGYAVTGDASHNCGELGGLGQNRMRWFLVARCRRRVPQFVYQPPRRRVRACGEVIGPMPMPGDLAAGGPLHAIPKISWRNWVRLSLIPAGGDWRDLPGVVPDDHDRREVHPGAAVGSSDAGVENVADPRFTNIMQVAPWDQPARTVIGASRVGSGALSVADPRLAAFGLGQTAEGAGSFKGRPGLFGVSDWHEPAPTVTSSAKVSGSNAPAAVADPRPRDWFPNVLGVTAWDAAAGTVTSQGRATTGAFSVADPRLGCAPRAGAYRVLGWEEAAATITGSLAIDNGPAAVADPRLPDPKKPPPFVPVIVAADGTWHRPLTTLELAALQGLPLIHRGAPLQLAGAGHTRWREAVGNAIPPPAAQAVGEQLLLALLVAKLGAFALSSNEIWVAPPLALGAQAERGEGDHAHDR